MSTFKFPRTTASALRGAETVLLLAPKSAIAGGWHQKLLPPRALDLLQRPLEEAEPGDLGVLVAVHTGEERPRRVIVGVMPDRVSRHNSPTRSEFVLHCATSANIAELSKVTVLCHVEDGTQVTACACAVGRAVPLFSRKSNKKKKAAGALSFIAIDGKHRAQPSGATLAERVETMRWAAELVDTPTAELDTAAFVRRARAKLRGLKNVRTRVITGAELLAAGLGGIHGVGRAAETAPRLLLLEYRPTAAKGKSKRQLTVGLVGKGVVYDTGGLSLKVGGSMPGMKADMGGAAAVVGAFAVLAAERVPHRVICAAPLAENSINEKSYRPDDILTMHSGKTVEINNTDAEGRLLLADGVSYVGRKYSPDLIIDAATLTGAQLVASGYRHASVVTNRDGVEELAVAAGRSCGDLVHPLLFAPEFYQSEFKSLVADMKNSVKDRMNAQSSCAAQFVYSHIADLDVPWLHIDMAGPATRNGRGTGYGVSLIAQIVRTLESKHLSA